jgi:hypothetical protein
MPNQNRKGPKGKGPKTGRKLGKCQKTESEQKQMVEPIEIQEKQPSANVSSLINSFRGKRNDNNLH